jgi:hypothetical protein
MGFAELAEARKWTGDPLVAPAAGLLTLTVAKAAAAKKAQTHNRRTVFFNKVSKLFNFPGGIWGV